jgi:hypothetical protein
MKFFIILMLLARGALSQLPCFNITPGTICFNETDCLLNSTCNGIDPTCPPPILKSPATLCRNESDCIFASFCDENMGNCSIRFKPAGQICRNVSACIFNGQCRPGNETCQIMFRPSGTPCVNDSLSCSNGGFCNGINDTCIISFAKPSGTICLNATDCAQTSYCNGINFTCPLPNPKTNGTTCRNATGLCDIPEKCDGINIACPTDIFLSNGTICRLNNDTFGNPTRCDGTGPFCPILNIKRDFAYSIKCGKTVYFCGIESIDEVTFKNKKKILFAGTSIRDVSSVSILNWPECLQSCTPLKCPNKKRVNNIVIAKRKANVLQRTWITIEKITVCGGTSFPI